MTLVVQKYGGTSVADLDRIRNVAGRIKRHAEAGERVAVVVSAMAGTTNRLVGWVRASTPRPTTRPSTTRWSRAASR